MLIVLDMLRHENKAKRNCRLAFFLRRHIKEENKSIGFQDLSDSIVMEITSVTEMN